MLDCYFDNLLEICGCSFVALVFWFGCCLCCWFPACFVWWYYAYMSVDACGLFDVVLYTARLVYVVAFVWLRLGLFLIAYCAIFVCWTDLIVMWVGFDLFVIWCGLWLLLWLLLMVLVYVFACLFALVVLFNLLCWCRFVILCVSGLFSFCYCAVDLFVWLIFEFCLFDCLQVISLLCL